ncbi:putative RING finger protein [Rosellinia necatrix]|uniref:RING-type E3 ubiquitin transferase n=1 Tax=Rosellinia necatrix TaxID=77044 RepID=A0A1W2THW6_ROSNE|nr:putative RING finger protein [Rosellinia necatrix]
MLSQPAGVPSPTIFEPLASSTSSPPTSSTRRRLSGLINLRSYAANSLLSSRESSNSRNLNRHSIHGAIFRSSSIRGNSDSRARSATRSSNAASSQEESALAATITDALNLNGTDYLAEPLSITLDTTIVDPIPTRPRGNTNRSSSPDPRRFSTRFCEIAADALLQERSALSPSPEPELSAAAAAAAADEDMTRSRSATLGNPNEMSPGESLPSIRLSAFLDPRSSRPSLSFTPVTRTLPTGKETIKVGRYSERENHAPVPMNAPSSAPVGFKSKVVSRRHCEFWFEKGKWYIKDVKSSSGTFLNHIRLSAPASESKPYPINDGDIVQLGIDFKGGEEMIYRCVKMRVELNRGWQAKPNTFNMATHKRLRDLTSTAASASASSSSHAQDCSICLNAIAPCQSLFVAPCSHTWHYKCIREMLQGPSWPIFMCPNCRATADLDAEVDEPSEEWQQLPEQIVEEKNEAREAQEAQEKNTAITLALLQLNGELHGRHADQGDPADMTMGFESTAKPQPPSAPSRHATSNPVPIPNATQRRTPSPTQNIVVNGHGGPLTPRNDVGPWVFDGNPARVSQESARRNGMGSLNAAAQAGSSQV